MIRAAVIGVGAMGRNHARVYDEMLDVDLVAIADANADTVREVARLRHAPAFTSYHELLNQARPDIVSVAVPTTHHHQVVRDALDAGCHVLVEKPIAENLDQGRDMIACAAEVGRVLAVGHIERYNPAIVELKRRLRAGELGRIFQLHARRLGPFPARVRDVGVIVDLATHDLDIMRFLTGAEVCRLYAETEQQIHTAREDLFSGLVRFEDGTLGVLDINWLTPSKVRELSVTGQGGMFLANLLTQDLYLFENDEANGLDWNHLSLLRGVSEGRMVRLQLRRKEPLRAELEAFAAAALSPFAAAGDEGLTVVSGEDGLAALQLAQALIEAGQACRIVEFGQDDR
jgi:UDP-N-acetylglucosamine 3-dehydrogenase